MLYRQYIIIAATELVQITNYKVKKIAAPSLSHSHTYKNNNN